MMEPAPGSVGFFPRSESGAVGTFWIHDTRAPVTAGHVAFGAEDRAAVDAFHAAAVAARGTHNGGPGPPPRHPESYYGAFVLDPHGVHVVAGFPPARAGEEKKKAPGLNSRPPS